MTLAVGGTLLWLIAQAPQLPPGPRVIVSPQDSTSTRLAEQGGEPDIVLQLEQRWAGPDAFLPLITSLDPVVRHYALRAIGRLRDPRVVPQLLAETADRTAPRPDIAAAIAGSLRGFDPRSDPKLIAQVADWLFRRAEGSDPTRTSPYLLPMSRIAYTTPEQVHRVERLLVQVLDETATSKTSPSAGVCAAAADGLGWLARDNRKVPFDRPTVQALDSMVAAAHANDTAAVRFSALSALIAGGGVDQETERVALKDRDEEVRRLALTVLAGSGGGLPGADRLSLALDAMNDPSPLVRFEALRAYVKRGGGKPDCQPILEHLNDAASHVALEAIDAMGTACPDNAVATDTVAAAVTMPPAHGAWNRSAHAFVALATRAPDRAAPLMNGFASHPLWWVRLYGVRAAAAMKDVPYLEKLAFDSNDNVREAALTPLRQLGGPAADRAIVAALDRSDYQLLRRAALLLKDSPSDDKFATPLVSALLRVTAEHKDTSRDPRLALLDAIGKHGTLAAGTAILPLAKDVDPQVAASAASIASRLTGRPVVPEPPVVARGWPRRAQDLRQCVQVDLSSGRGFLIQMLPQGAPIAVDHFLTLATVDHYYDGLTFHRVEPNFVIQGGSPNANEYSGAPSYMRDEVALGNARGTVGLSTRGPNTGDAQIYVNLVDNRRLDDDYTVFARVVTNLDAVEQIEEGEQIVRMAVQGCPAPTQPDAIRSRGYRGTGRRVAQAVRGARTGRPRGRPI